MLEIYEWSGEGFEPLVFTTGWQAALLNWEPLFDRRNLDEIERHNHSDEVFVLLRGRAMLFTRPDGGALAAVEMEAWAKFTMCRLASGTIWWPHAMSLS